MIKIAQQTIKTNAPTRDVGFLQMPEKANKTFLEAFEEELRQYSSTILPKIINGHCGFDNEGLLQGSNPFVLAIFR